MTINKKSTIFFQSSWNLVKMITSWANYFHQVSWRLDKKCGFFINGQFLNMSRFFSSDFNFTWDFELEFVIRNTYWVCPCQKYVPQTFATRWRCNHFPKMWPKWKLDNTLSNKKPGVTPTFWKRNFVLTLHIENMNMFSLQKELFCR